MNKSELKIGIVGAAGMGKSSLAQSLSSRLNIPLLKSKEVTQEILRRDGYDYASGIQVERFLASPGRQNEILRHTREQQQQAPSFVTDRTLIDLAAYASVELYPAETQTLRDIMGVCRKNVGIYTHLFLCPWTDSPLEPNNRRTLNPWYQHLIHMVELGILTEWGCPYTVLTNEDTEKRKQDALKVVQDIIS